MRSFKEHDTLKVLKSGLRKKFWQVQSRIGIDGLLREPECDLPLRSVMYSAEQLDRHAEGLAEWHRIDPQTGPDRLRARLADNERVLLEAYRLVSVAVETKQPISPASEWLLDNFYLIEEQIRTARSHLPERYSRGLPRLQNGPSAGYPLVYDLALELISHVDGRIDVERLQSFVSAYQRRRPLTLGELWAVPIMFRQALIENLRRVAARIASATVARSSAADWSRQFQECVEATPHHLVLLVADLARSNITLSSAFVAEITRQLQGHGTKFSMVLTWIEQRLSEQGLTLESTVQSEGQQQAVDQVSISNSIGGLRKLDAIDWRNFVESLSVVEQTLRLDPAGVYRDMDFLTRDQYRKVVEQVAKEGALGEQYVALRAVALARTNSGEHGDQDRFSHVGYYLIDSGLSELERSVQRTPSIWIRCYRASGAAAWALYALAIFGLAAVIAGGLDRAVGITGVGRWVAVALLFLAATQFSVSLVNWLATLLIIPRRLPRMDFSRGIAPDCATLVVVPTMLVHTRGIERLLEGLEVRYLANCDEQLRFCLLTDFRDADQAELPADAELLELARQGIIHLNEKYPASSDDRFYLLHRPRLWNPQERVWMGRERKRGKLSDLNALLRGGSTNAFALIAGQNPASLQKTKYVITLDTDTLLPRDAAYQLVGVMAHVLNRAQIDAQRRIVVGGYGILQPGVSAQLGHSAPSPYARLNSGQTGIDPYTRAISDVYQDLCGEGSFIGKGIYDVDAFIETMDQRFPDNQILSHDLLEGCYARSGLVSDVHLFEIYPERYNSDISRRHRWMRGDWQIAPWLLPRVPSLNGNREPNPLSQLSRWKIADNLRRSLIPCALLLMLILGWLLWPPAWVWTGVVVGIVLLPTICASLVSMGFQRGERACVQHLDQSLRAAGTGAAQGFLTLAFLPFEACVSADAILRTIVRMLFTRRKMLEWTTASDAERDGSRHLWGSVRTLGIAPLLAIGLWIVLQVWRPDAVLAATPLLTLWLFAPWIAWRVSQPLVDSEQPLTAQQRQYLYGLARKTWHYFETFVGPEDHWLPPDNYQQHPVAVVAHRTSPTNIGIALLSNLAAYDFGFISTRRLLDRTANTLRTLENLERYRGHFLNWYDTQTLQPLMPRYVSSVDSGNLSGHLLTLRAGLLELPDQPLTPLAFWAASEVLHQEHVAIKFSSTPSIAAASDWTLLQELLQKGSQLRKQHLTLLLSSEWLLQLTAVLREIRPVAMNYLSTEARLWLEDLEDRCQQQIEDLEWSAPWLAHSITLGTERNPDSVETAALREQFQSLQRQLVDSPTWNTVVDATTQMLAILDQWESLTGESTPPPASDSQTSLDELRSAIGLWRERAHERLRTIQLLAQHCVDYSATEYDFLYDPDRRLLAIGFNVSERRRDDSYYDLLASESRLASFVAIAQGQLPQEHWFALGRLLTTSNHRQMLLSWSGSMFEYLMPLLVMPTYRKTLLDQTCRGVVEWQRKYGTSRGIPWGVSESGYSVFDARFNYQYRAFGVPGLGFKRGLAEDLVIAPYATAMALMVAPRPACSNLQTMSAAGFEGDYGFYEAIDYTRSRLPPEQPYAIVQSFMAHHQGMSLLAMAYCLLGQPMQRRFLAYPQFQATELLLQERIPQVASFFPHAAEVERLRDPAQDLRSQLRVFRSPHTPVPEVHLLSNGRYHVMVTNSGGGYSQWKGLAITRWREDATRDASGQFCYLRDVATGDLWSTSFQPTRVECLKYEAIFSQARAEFRRRDFEIKLHTEIAVSPEDDIEIRRVTLTNRSRVVRTIELTSYAEVVLAVQAADTSHPAFSNLFVQTEIISEQQSILCTRRPRSHQEQPPWMLHLLAVRGATRGETSYETDRLKFIGRRNGTERPEALRGAGRLSNTDGPVLDPIVAIRRRVTIAPDESISVDFITGVAVTRDAALQLIAKYRDHHLADRVLEMAWTHGQVLLRQLNATESDAQLYGRLASFILYAHSALRAQQSILSQNERGQSGLWGHSISGDLPIVLLRIAHTEKLELVRQLVQAHAYWRLKGLAVDLVIWNDAQNGYRQELQDCIISLGAIGSEAPVFDRPGGMFVRRADQLSEEDRTLLQTVARVFIRDDLGTLSHQLERRTRLEVRIPELVPARNSPIERPVGSTVPEPLTNLHGFNGYGGFTPDGREYVIQLLPGKPTPAPWVNVLANPEFGTVISESGSAYTWSENAHEYRVTPWFNDPVSDSSGEAFYLRDETSGQVWSPFPQPIRSTAPYKCRHGFGYTVFEHSENGIATEVWVYVSIEHPVKYIRLKIRNVSGRHRRLSATGYVEWTLGELREKGLLHVVTEVDPQCKALLARNPYSIEFSQRIPFFDVSELNRTVTGDRAEFLGRNGSTAKPAALARQRLSNQVGAGFDPCGGMQAAFDLADGREHEVVFTLGVGRDLGHVRQLVERIHQPDTAQQELDGVWNFWNHTLGAVHVETPDPAVNALANGWLLYQTLACRFWARSGFYQSGGAIGFRDQLQDISALLHAQPHLIRSHLLLCASRQFTAGDVQHWWHPPAGRGVRTHFSDDFLWLPLLTCRYISGTGDIGILDEIVPFLEGRDVASDEDAYYDLPATSTESANFYEHCVRAVTHGLRFGTHGLPLMGGGDWNDGMNLVGHAGRGESVWLAFFLYEILNRFAEIARSRGDTEFSERCTAIALELSGNIEQHAWDGAWYRRAFFDNGEPLGSADSDECQIDSLPQSWAVLSGAGQPARSAQAMTAVNERLVRRKDGLIQLFDPPFNSSHLDPGYIKGYVPGVRENGGQYTHAAVWTVMAFAKLGDTERAWELFRLINPIRHGSSPAAISTYKVEPYVVAADVYAVAPHTGRGGWTWYTGSASWMYRLITESLLGLQLEVDQLRFSPCLPAEWKSLQIHYRYRSTYFHITILQPEPGSRVTRVVLDGVEREHLTIPLTDDLRSHAATVTLS